jgi:enoyl-CoA hydratase
VLTGEAICAEEALRIGLVNQVVEAPELIQAAETLAAKIIANPPMAVKYSIEVIDRGMDMPQAEALHMEATVFGLLCATEDMREGMRAFLDKRPAQFKNR